MLGWDIFRYPLIRRFFFHARVCLCVCMRLEKTKRKERVHVYIYIRKQNSVSFYVAAASNSEIPSRWDNAEQRQSFSFFSYFICVEPKTIAWFLPFAPKLRSRHEQRTWSERRAHNTCRPLCSWCYLLRFLHCVTSLWLKQLE